MERLGAFIKKHRLWLGGLCCALAAAFALAWAGYTLQQAGKNQSEYRIVHDEYVEKQGLYPTDPAAGLVQGLPAGEGETLYGVRLMFVTGGRVAQGAFRVALESAGGQTLAACDGDMTMLLDGAFVDVIFASPVGSSCPCSAIVRAHSSRSCTPAKVWMALSMQPWQGT